MAMVSPRMQKCFRGEQCCFFNLSVRLEQIARSPDVSGTKQSVAPSVIASGTQWSAAISRENTRALNVQKAV